MTTLEILEAARAKIADPEHWTREAEARCARGEPTDPDDPKATQWCALGAVIAIAPNEDGDVSGYLDEAATDAGFLDATDLNDSSDHADVLEMFDQAIAELKVSEA